MAGFFNLSIVKCASGVLRHLLWFSQVILLLIAPDPTLAMADYCSEGLIKAMKEQGMPAKDIRTVCARAEQYDRETGIRGIIQDAAGNPVAGIDVHINGMDHETTTRRDGSFKLPCMEGEGKITFSSHVLLQRYLPPDQDVVCVKEDCHPHWLELGVLQLPVAILHDTKQRLKYASKDRRFIDNGDGTVSDTKTGLMWASRDNGANVNWFDAKHYCEKYTGGGHNDWRLPTLEELTGIYDPSTRNQHGYHVTDLFDFTYSPWGAETRGDHAVLFHYGAGKVIWYPKDSTLISRVLPVRRQK